jgi:hypothetical protein
MKPRRLLLSYSGGRTSAFMTKYMLDNCADEYDDIRVVFANTGQESPETLDFVHECDKRFGFNVVWVEAEVNHKKRVGTKHKIVSYETASRRGEPFEDVIKKYGIPNKAFPHCTRELKLRPITSYLRSIGWGKGSYDTAIGIRADEIDRVSSRMAQERIVYPLIERIKTVKQDIDDWWGLQEFNLYLPEHRGNCMWCWKKSLRKLLTLAVEDPSMFEFPARMEAEYGLAGHNIDGTRRVFFRQGRSTQDILNESLKPFEPFIDNRFLNLSNFDSEMDAANGCSESCEVF